MYVLSIECCSHTGDYVNMDENMMKTGSEHTQPEQDTEKNKGGLTERSVSVAIVCAGVLWGTIGIFVRQFNAVGLTSLDICEIRSLGCALFMVVIMLVRDHRFPRIRLRDLWCFLGTGLLSILLFNVCYFATIQMSSMSVAAVLLYTSPAFVMILSRILFKERMSKTKFVALGLTLLGVVLTGNVIGTSASLPVFALITGILSGVGYALYTIFSRYALDRGYEPLTIVTYTYIVAAIGGAFIANFGNIGSALSTGTGMMAIAVLYVLLSTVIPFTLYTGGLAHVSNSKASIIVSVEPVAATIFGFLFFGETPTLSVVLGMVCILTAIVLLNLQVLRKGKTSKDRPAPQEK